MDAAYALITRHGLKVGVDPREALLDAPLCVGPVSDLTQCCIGPGPERSRDDDRPSAQRLT